MKSQETIINVWENFDNIANVKVKTSTIKNQAATYLDLKDSEDLNRHDFYNLLSKTQKIKTHLKKADRARNLDLEKQLISVYSSNR